MKHRIKPFRTMTTKASGEKIYFDFEQDFVEEGMRCIPMIVRFKMDAAGIKLKLGDWCKFTLDERLQLALMPVNNQLNLQVYYNYLSGLVQLLTGCSASPLITDLKPVWNNCTKVPEVLVEKTSFLAQNLSVKNWAGLHELQRFALVKLCTSDHENKNLPKALAEFGLIQNEYAS